MGGAPTDNETKFPTSFQNWSMTLIYLKKTTTSISFLVHPSLLSEIDTHLVHLLVNTC